MSEVRLVRDVAGTVKNVNSRRAHAQDYNAVFCYARGGLRYEDFRTIMVVGSGIPKFLAHVAVNVKSVEVGISELWNCLNDGMRKLDQEGTVEEKEIFAQLLSQPRNEEGLQQLYEMLKKRYNKLFVLACMDEFFYLSGVRKKHEGQGDASELECAII